MQSRVVENITDTPINLAHLTHEVSKAKVLIEDVLDDGKRKVGRMLKRGVVTAEDCVEDSTHFIKRHPWQSVGAALGFGACVGLLAGWLTTRSWQTNGQD
jgi:ElaB/YqjD/DUF883 family membrane-anchored ribosome-binding protein